MLGLSSNNRQNLPVLINSMKFSTFYSSPNLNLFTKNNNTAQLIIKSK